MIRSLGEKCITATDRSRIPFDISLTHRLKAGGCLVAEDVYVAIRDAFDHAKRKLEDYARRIRGDVKTHELESRGRIARLFSDEGYGFIAKADGTDLYFHRFNVVHPDFDHLHVGDEVVFVEETGDEGL